MHKDKGHDCCGFLKDNWAGFFFPFKKYLKQKINPAKIL
jgi:hypothetical protein